MEMNNYNTQKDYQASSISLKEDFMPNDLNNKKELSIKHSKLLEEVKNLLKEEHFRTLDMVDCLQKLCIDHYFRKEIDSILKMLYARISNGSVYKHDDQSLFEVSRYFRILRQEGYYVSSDVFSFIMQNDGRFKGEIAQDVKGLMALYEASQLSIGESIFEEAVEFCSNRLNEMMPFLDQDEILMVKNTLEHPYQRTSSSFMVKNFINHYAGTTMSQLAELELANVRSIHRMEVEKISSWWKDLGLAQELKLARNQPLNWYLWPMASLTDPSLSDKRVELTKPIALIFIIDDIYDVYGTLDELIVFTESVNSWWKDLGLAQELKLARNQPLNWYLWPMASLTDPSLSDKRVELTKPIALIFIIDDIYDVYGTLDELIVFTESVNRWDYDSLDRLPYHQRICIRALFDVTNDISDKIYKKYEFNPIEYLKKTWITLCEAFLVEARWFASGNLPMAEDYLKNGIVSSGAQVFIVHMFFLLGGGTSKETASIMNDNQGIAKFVAKILRLWDDLGSAKDENQDGHDGSYVMYYMKENEGCSIQNAREHVMAMISDTWKQLNKGVNYDFRPYGLEVITTFVPVV